MILRTSRSKFFSSLVAMLLTVGLTISWEAETQTIGKHPRAIELENHLTKVASDFLRGRFPNAPFTVVVVVDPLHRYPAKTDVSSGEVLPYLPQEVSDQVDEWDDPIMSLPGLVTRVKRIVVTLGIPRNVSEDETAEIEQSLTTLMNLVPARDQIKIHRREWGGKEENSLQFYLQIGLVAGGILMLLLGGWLISRTSSRSFADALNKAKPNNEPMMPQSRMMPSLPMTDSGAQRVQKSGSGDLKFNDPIKIRESILQIVANLKDVKGFPTLQDMLILDKVGSEKPEILGSLLVEFPIAVQKLVFGYSTAKYWLKAMSNPGDLNYETLELAQKILHVQRAYEENYIQKLLISFWRLGKKRAEFLRTMDRPVALAMLSNFPKSISVEAAKQAFPGSWGEVLDFDQPPVAMDVGLVVELVEKIRKIQPYRDFSAINQYRQISDLLEYLKIATPADEKDIYLTIKAESMLPEIRPPFYPVVEMEVASAGLFVNMVPIDEWALVLFNLSKDNRRVIEARFSEKQQFIFKEKMRSLDANNPDPQLVGEKREQIARIFREFSAHHETSQNNSQDNSSNETASADDKKAA